jgi:RHS repeat-associated protein
LDLSGSLQGAGGVGGLLSVREYVSRAGVYQFSYDANGNVSEVIRADGVIAAHYEYGAFGETVLETGSYRQQNPFKFSTKPSYDGLQGLYYYGFRYYNPSIGRWLTHDPFAEGGGINLYVFCSNSGVDNIDVLGMFFGPDAQEYLRAQALADHARRQFQTQQYKISLPSLSISLALSELTITGCGQTPIPGLSVCLKGKISLTAKYCCGSDQKQKTLVTASGSFGVGGRVGSSGFSVTPGKAVKVDVGSDPCPSNPSGPEYSGTIEIMANAYFVSGGGSCTYSKSGWSCGGEVSVAKGYESRPSSLSYGIDAYGLVNVSGEYLQ